MQVNAEPFARLIPNKHKVLLFAAALRERRIIFVSQHLALVSECAQSLVGLLYPFSWQYIFIPVLPRTLLPICCSPIPFVLGVHARCLPELLGMESDMEPTWIYNVDRCMFVRCPLDETSTLPTKPLKLLQTDLAKVKKKHTVNKLLRVKGSVYLSLSLYLSINLLSYE
jgi:DENN (AEX-3) domain